MWTQFSSNVCLRMILDYRTDIVLALVSKGSKPNTKYDAEGSTGASLHACSVAIIQRYELERDADRYTGCYPPHKLRPCAHIGVADVSAARPQQLLLADQADRAYVWT